jgi:hypothetical protein
MSEWSQQPHFAMPFNGYSLTLLGFWLPVWFLFALRTL